MLVEYKSDYEKITMGLLSLISDFKEMNRLTKELEWYQQEDNRHLYLWKSEETGDLCGVIGLEEDDLILLRHIAINPSYRDEGLAYEMIEAVSNRFENKNIVGTIETGKLVTKWQKRRNESEKQLDNFNIIDNE